MTSCIRKTGALLLACAMMSGPALAAAAAASASASHAEARTARNLADFDFTVEKITQNYSGYETKTAGDGRAALDALSARLRKKVASEAMSDDQFTDVLKEWIGFFRDGHTTITAIQAPGPASADTKDPEALAAAVPRRDWSETDVVRRLSALGDHRDPVEGVWSISGDRYRMAILRDGDNPEEFTSVVLTSTAEGWTAGMVKATLKRRSASGYAIDYFAGDFSRISLEGEVLLDGAAVDIGQYGTWVREWPALPDRDMIARRLPSDEFFIRRLSPRTLWLRLPDFNDVNSATVAKLIEENAEALASTDNLLIDTRQNGGGSDFVYQPIIPWLYTRPIYSIGMEMRASADNIALRQEVADELRRNPDAAETVREMDAEIQSMRRQLGRYVQPDERPFRISRLERIAPFPKRVAILIDNAGSSGEQFLLDARQSRKVTLFGKVNSAGVLDFANVVSMTSPSGRHRLQWATSRSLRLPHEPVDDGGIAPDIRIPESEPDPVTYAQRWLERQVD